MSSYAWRLARSHWFSGALIAHMDARAAAMVYLVHVSQLDLFGTDSSDDDAAARIAELAQRLPAHVRFGTSSWTFKGWQGVVYRKRYATPQDFTQHALAEYAEFPLFRTVGVDRSFYEPIAEPELRAYAAQVPSDFRFVQKVWAGVSSPVLDVRSGGESKVVVNETFLDPLVFLRDQLLPTLNALGSQHGVFLLSISPSRGSLRRVMFEDKLEAFLRELPPGTRIAVELRELRFATKRYFALLNEFGAVHCLNHWTNMPRIADQMKEPHVLDGPFVLARLMLPQGRRYDSMKAKFEPFNRIVEIAPTMRADVAQLVRRTGELGKETYVLVNNKVEGSSPLTVVGIAEEIVGAAVQSV